MCTGGIDGPVRPAEAFDKRHVAAASVIAALSVAAYYGLLTGGWFLADDYELLNVARGLKLSELVTASFYREFPWRFIRPLGVLIWKANYIAYGLTPAGYYLTNLALHICCAILAAWYVAKLSGNGPAGFVAGVLFAVHPSHPDAASYLAGRFDLACTLFYLAGLVSYASYRERADMRLYALTLAMFTLCLASKEMAVTFPFALMLYELFYRHGKGDMRGMAKRAVPFLLVLAAYFAVRYHLFHGMGGYKAESGGSVHASVPAVSQLGYNLLTYLRTMLLGINYKYPADFTAYTYAVSAIAVIGMAALVRSGRDALRAAAFLSMLTMFCLVPVTGISPVRPDLMGARYVYLSSAFFMGITGVAFMPQRPVSRMVRAGLAVCIVALAVSYFAVLKRNNEPYLAASALSRAIPEMFVEIYPEPPANADITLYDVPQIIAGAPIFLDNPGGMKVALLVAYGYPDVADFRVGFKRTEPGQRTVIDTAPRTGSGRNIILRYDDSSERLIPVYDSAAAPAR